MAKAAAIERPTVQSISAHVNKNADYVKKALGHQHDGAESVREASYEGHHIVIRTTYHIQVDGMSITGHVGVTNDGQVHYHAVPNVSFASAVDMVERLIDLFPDDFAEQGHGQNTSDDHTHRHSTQSAAQSKHTQKSVSTRSQKRK